MNTAKKIAVCGAFSALLIAVQYVFSAVSGIELVTVFLFAFCFSFGFTMGISVAFCFCFLRGFIFGFFPSVTLLYFIYYPLFAIVASFTGKLLAKSSPFKQVAFSSLVALILTLCFTMIDNVVTPVFFSYNETAWKAYAIQSVLVAITQAVCAVLSTVILFLPLKKAFSYIAKRVLRG